jgi:hypothetical protein
VGDDGRARHRQAEELKEAVRLGAGLREALVDLALQRRRHSEASEAHRKVHPRQPQLVLATAERHRVGGRGIGLCQQLFDAFVHDVDGARGGGARDCGLIPHG